MIDFPDPYPDELFYSLCARYAQRMKYPSKQAIFLNLFNTHKYVVSAFMALRLNDWIQQLLPDSDWTVDKIIDNHTLFPFAAPFLSIERVQKLRASMGEAGRLINRVAQAGLQGPKVRLPIYLRYCPACVVADRQQHSETYWHRLHQVPGVLVCPIHQSWLVDSSVPTRTNFGPLSLISAEQTELIVDARPLEGNDLTKQTLLYLAREYAWLGTQSGLHFDITELRQRYFVALISRKLASPRGVIFRVKLGEEFQTYYSTTFLQLIQCELPSPLSHSWLEKMLERKPRNNYPLYHLLFAHFLGYTIAELLTQPNEYHPFGEGPWPCLNPICPYYQQPHIPVVQVDYRKGGNQPLGTFACECGYIYKRFGPDGSPADRLRRNGPVLAYGSVWEEKLKALWLNQKMDYLQIATELGVSVHCMKKQAARLRLRNTPGGRRWHEEEPPAPDLYARRAARQAALRETHRAQWEDVLANEPDLRGTALIEKYHGVYQFLHRNDKEWLLKKTPVTPAGVLPKRQNDWAALDAELAPQIREVAAELKQQISPFRRVTGHSIQRQLGKKINLAYLEKLPQSAQVLAEVVETHEKFAVRRVWQVAEMFCKEGVIPSRSKFVKRVGISSLQYHPLVANDLNTALEMLRQSPPNCQGIHTRLEEILGENLKPRKD